MIHGTSVAQIDIQEHSAARVWMDQYLNAIKEDGLGPTIHARNLFHLSIAMYDAWEVYNGGDLNTFFLGKEFGGYTCEFEGIQMPENIDSAMNVAINYAAFRYMVTKFNTYSSKVRILDTFISKFDSLGFNSRFHSADYSGGSPAALGNYIAAKLIEFGLSEPAGDEDGYEGYNYSPVNKSLRPDIPGNKNLKYKNRWQPLAMREYVSQKGWDPTLQDWNYLLILPEDDFLTPHWGEITPFAMGPDQLSEKTREGTTFKLYNDPGFPPLIGKNDEHTFGYQWNFSLVNSWGAHNDPADETKIDISPAAIGPTTGLLPNSINEYLDFFDFENGGVRTTKQDVNPTTGKAYEHNLVKRGDYTRVIAEYWVDGVNTMGPPGHWIHTFNESSDHPSFEKRWAGKGPVLSDLEWDIKSYLAICGALHDAGISAWSAKAYYDYIRPISAIRWMAENGQCSDTTLSNYNSEGLPLVSGQIEVVKRGDPLAKANKENIGKMKMHSWRGHEAIDDVNEDVAGSGWILAENWWPYQRYSFATPPFAGYVSGHSTFSIAAAEIITLITGDPYFPGGLKEITFEKDSFLEFEKGPSEDITLQWATYREAADETCLSRIWGGIHPPVDDIEGRKIGEKVAVQAFEFSNKIFNNSHLLVDEPLRENRNWTSLAEMCEAFPTDKCSNGHNFIEEYDVLFAPMRDTMDKFFEIGILNGVSHLMWNEYFPNARVYGIDIWDYSEKSKGTGIETFVADQSNRDDLQAFIDKYGGGFDVILDDGGHAMDHQQVSFGFLFKHLNPGGYYIIEDVHTSLPNYYPDPAFKVNEDESNTTLKMLENFVRNSNIVSQYMTVEEMAYIEENIETMDISYRITRHHSIMCVIKKKM
tara:strand:+ start:690 stop:3299 length:2610 start_codon:yes stop_codon:yes gene_type:complete